MWFNVQTYGSHLERLSLARVVRCRFGYFHDTFELDTIPDYARIFHRWFLLQRNEDHDPFCFMVQCLGHRFTGGHLRELERIALQSGLGFLDVSIHIDTLDLDLDPTQTVGLFRGQGMYWFVASGEPETEGTCAHCGESVYNVFHQVVCLNCHESVSQCEDCSEYTYNGVCPSCERARDENSDDDDDEQTQYHLLKNHSYVPYFYFFGSSGSRFQGRNKQAIFFGHEIEMVCRNRDLVSNLTSRGDVYCKADGSLPEGSGLEVVTHPMTYEYSLDCLRNISKIAWEHDAKSFNAPNQCCGHHIHIGINAWSDYAIHRAIGAMGLSEWRSVLVFVSQRELEQLNRWASPLKVSKYNATQIAKWKNGSDCIGRYTALNVTPRTVEFRLFRGNIVSERLIKNMQFALATWQIAHSMLPFNRETLVEICKAHHYTELLTFCKNRTKGFTNNVSFDL